MTQSSRVLAMGASLTLALLVGFANAAEPRPAAVPVKAPATAPAAAPAPVPAAGSLLVTKESPLGQLPSKDARSLSISADNRHVAVLRKISSTVDGKTVDKFIVSVDGKDQKEYDWIVANSLTFSSDSSVCAYVVQDAKGMYPVIGGVESKPCFEILKSDIFAIPGGKSFAWFAKARAGGKNYVVINGEDGKEFDEVGNLVFSPDGKRWAYAVRSGEKMYFLIDNKPTAEYDMVVNVSFAWSADSLHYAFSAVKGKGEGAKVVVVIDGKEQEKIESTSPVRVFFSPDNQRTAFVISDAKSMTIYIDGAKAKTYDRILGDTVRFSPDSKRVGYIAGRVPKGEDKGGTFYVVDGQETRSYEQIVLNSLIFSPDSKRFAFVVAKDLPADKGKRLQAIIDTLGGAEYEDLRAAQFSPDSKHFAYLARRENRTYAVVDNTEGVGYQQVSSLQFSPDGKRMAYIAFRDQTSFVVNEVGVEGASYAGIVEGTMVFSPDGQHLAYEARREKAGDKPNEKKLIPFFVVDKLETAEHGGSLRGSRITWDENNKKVRGIVLRDEGKIFLMDIEVPG